MWQPDEVEDIAQAFLETKQHLDASAEGTKKNPNIKKTVQKQSIYKRLSEQFPGRTEDAIKQLFTKGQVKTMLETLTAAGTTPVLGSQDPQPPQLRRQRPFRPRWQTLRLYPSPTLLPRGLG